MPLKIQGSTTNNGLEVDATNNGLVKTPGKNSTGVDVGGGNNNAPAIFSEVDGGTKTSSRYVLSPEADDDYRLRVNLETILDDENFNYTAQNTGKHQLQNTTQTITFSAAGMLTNGSAITTTTTGCSYRSYAMFPIQGTGQIIYAQFSASFSATPVANSTIDFGLFQQPTSNPFAPTDGVYFRLDSTGFKAVINNNATELETSISSAFTYVINRVYKFTIAVSDVQTLFYIDDILYARVTTPIGQGTPCLSEALPMGIRQTFIGAAGGAIQALFKAYSVSIGGLNYSESIGNRNNAVVGSYQGLSGGTMGQLIAGTVTTGTLVKPTAAVPANASLVANLPNNLGGRIYEQLTTGLAANTDAIFASYTVPAGTVSVIGKRLKVTGIKLSGMVSTVVVGGPAFTEWYIAFGHTADSLQTAEAATTKAPRRVMLPELTTNMPAAAAAGALLVQPQYFAKFDNPIYVNPGERIQLVGNKTITTAVTSGVLSFTYQFDYSWE